MFRKSFICKENKDRSNSSTRAFKVIEVISKFKLPKFQNILESRDICY